MEKQLESKNIPYGYALCFNESCPLRDTCLHYQKLYGRRGVSRIYIIMCHTICVQRLAKRSAIISVTAADLITATIMATTSSRPVSRRTSWLSLPNTVAPTACPSIITKPIGTSTDHIRKGAAVMVAPSLNETKAILYLCKI